MKKSKYLIPALAIGILFSGGALYAFGGPVWDSETYKSFSTEEQSAIKQAFEIRSTANEEARTVLEKAGVDMDAMHEAMRKGRGAHHEEMEKIMESGDYQAFLKLTEGSPMADDITEAKFNKMVEAHKLMEAGDKEGAREIMDELGVGGKGFGGPGRHF
ncbi:MAG: hypothetical protein KBC44_03090 [Candidatus Pacebacteria bacterium]|nr:hypothetical protein [Candidatus Paceibacterota bacterium]MBP9839937.1 hypothetical protein [Candidatus Paceibacterota bacterium]